MKIKNVLYAVFGVLVLSGCATVGMKFTDEHTKAHNVEVQVDSKLNRYMKDMDLSHRHLDGKTFLALSGALQRPSGSFLSSLRVNAKFYDENDQIVAESSDIVQFNRMGGRTNRRYKGSLFLKVEDNITIKKCVLALQA